MAPNVSVTIYCCYFRGWRDGETANQFSCIIYVEPQTRASSKETRFFSGYPSCRLRSPAGHLVNGALPGPPRSARLDPGSPCFFPTHASLVVGFCIHSLTQFICPFPYVCTSLPSSTPPFPTMPCQLTRSTSSLWWPPLQVSQARSR